MPSKAALPYPTTHPGRPRIAALDVIRGFALCGILLANVQPIAATGSAAVEAPSGPEYAWLGFLVHQRFYVIFSLLFGIGFSLLLNSAVERVQRPRVVLLRRLLVLLGFGLVHHLLWPGDILTVYAVLGLVVLLPSTWLPRWAVLGLGGAFIAAALLAGAGHFAMVPGLFLLGSALTRYGVTERIEQPGRVPAVPALIFLVAAAPFLWWQAAGHTRAFTAAGLLLAGAYICVVALLLRTPLRTPLRVVFAPLGRMALTNYLTATLLVLASARLIGDPPAIGR